MQTDLEHAVDPGNSGERMVGSYESEPAGSTGELLRAIARPPLRILANGTRLGRFEICGVLGAGGMGIVYSAVDTGLGRKVAIKLQQHGHVPLARLRLEKEAQALAKLSHPNIVTVYDFGLHEDELWIAMEQVDGRTLRDWSHAQQRPWRESLRVLIDVARGLAAAHECALVHRDLKPDNVMVGDDGRARIMDFGLVHEWAGPRDDESAEASMPAGEHTSDQAQLTETGVLLGSPPYMAPERWRGLAAEPQADQFAWGVLAWEALYGRRPFAAPTLPELREQILAGAPTGLCPGLIPAWLESVVGRSLARDPDQRWRTVGELVDALERGLESTETRVDDPVDQARSAPTRRRFATIATTLAVLATVAAIVIARFRHSPEIVTDLAGDCHVRVDPLENDYTPAFNIKTDCVCGSASPECHQLYQGKVIALRGWRADLEFKKVTGGPPSKSIHYWVLSGARRLSCSQLDELPDVSDGYWSPRHDTLQVDNVPIWASQAAFDDAPPGSTRTITLATGDGAGNINKRTWYQPDALVFTKVCANP
jgi:serine/threonine protein kinase